MYILNSFKKYKNKSVWKKIIINFNLTLIKTIIKKLMPQLIK